MNKVDDKTISELNEIISRMIIKDQTPDDFKKIFDLSHNKGGKTNFCSLNGRDVYLSISSEDCSKLREIIQNLIKNNRDMRNNISDKMVYERLLELFDTIKSEGRKITSKDIQKKCDELLKSLPRTEFTVFHKIYGVDLKSDSPISKGIFTFYSIHKHKKIIDSIIYNDGKEPDGIKLLNDEFEKHDVWVSVSFQMKEDFFKAEERANKYFIYLENILRFFLYRDNTLFDIGIFDLKKSNVEDIYLLSGNRFSYSLNLTSGSSGNAILDDFFNRNDRFIPKLIELISKDDKTDMEKRILRSTYLGGMAISELDHSMGFLKCMMAIEALLQVNKEEISNQISENVSFILYGTGKETVAENRIQMYNIMKKLYSKRSELAHGSKVEIPLNDYNTAIYIIQLLIRIFLDNDIYYEMKKIDELEKYIQKLKFTVS